MLYRNIGIVTKLHQKCLLGTTGYLKNTKRNSHNDSQNQFTQKKPFRSLERGPLRGPGPEDKTDKNHMQMDQEKMQTTTFTLDSHKLSNYSSLSVDRVLNNGFLVQGREILGTPIAVIPDTVLKWNVTSHEDITCDSLALFYNCLPALDLVIIGTGTKREFIDPREINKLLSKGIKVEVCSTSSAAGTYNLLRDNRKVGAALLPDIEKIETYTDKFGQKPVPKTRNDLAHAYHEDNKLGFSKEQLRKNEEGFSGWKIPDGFVYKKESDKIVKPDLERKGSYKFGEYSSGKFGKGPKVNE